MNRTIAEIERDDWIRASWSWQQEARRQGRRADSLLRIVWVQAVILAATTAVIVVHIWR